MICRNTFHDLFTRIKERVLKNNEKAYQSFFICINQHVLEIRYFDDQYIDFAKKALKGIISEKKEAEAVIWCLEDKLDEYIPLEFCRESSKGILHGNDETGEIQIINNHVLSGADYIENEYYHIRNNQKDPQAYFYGHPLYPAFSLWAKRNHSVVIHGAAIGINGKGILLGAYGGAGKSTLSVAWMLAGHEIVGDDYVILNKKDNLIAEKIYTSVGLNKDIYETLNLNMDVIHTVKKRNEKKFFDASQYNFIGSLNINAIVYPIFDRNDCEGIGKPVIREIPPGKVITKMIYSTIQQMGETHNTTLIKELSQMLRGIPTYEICLSKDNAKNVRCLELFLQENDK